MATGGASAATTNQNNLDNRETLGYYALVNAVAIPARLHSRPPRLTVLQTMAQNSLQNDERGPKEALSSPSNKAGFLQRVFHWFFGYDYFIAHRSVDGKAYALALYDALTATSNRLDCFLDVKKYGAGGSLSVMQARALKKTTRLIVIVTPHAHDAAAQYLRNEVTEFRKMHPDGPIVPIGARMSLSREHYPNSPLFDVLPDPEDTICIYESGGDFGEWGPSPTTVAKLLNDFSEERGSAKRMRWIRRIVVLLSVLFFAAVGFGIYATRERNQALKAQAGAERALTNTFLRTIRTGVDDDSALSGDERESLWELSELEAANVNVRKRIIDEWVQATGSAERPGTFCTRGLHAAIGLNTSREGYFVSQTNGAVDRLTVRLVNPKETDLRSLGDAFAALAGRMNSTGARSAAVRLVKDTAAELDFDRLEVLGKAVGAVAACMNPTDAYFVAGRIANMIQDPMEAQTLRFFWLSEALAALAARMPPKRAAFAAGRGAAGLTRAMERTPETDPSPLRLLGEALVTLVSRMNAEDAGLIAKRGAAVLANALENRRRLDSAFLWGLGSALAGLAPRLSPEEAASVTGHAGIGLAKALENTPEEQPDLVRFLGKDLTALAVHMNSADASSVAVRLAAAMENPNETGSFRLGNFGSTLAALCTRMKPNDAAAAARRGAAALVNALESRKERRPDRIQSLALGLADLVGRMNSKESESFARRGSNFLVDALKNSDQPPEELFKSLSDLSVPLASLGPRLNPADAVSVASDLSEALENNSKSLFRIGEALAVFAACLAPADAALLAPRLAKAMENTPETDSERLSGLGIALAALVARQSQTDASSISERGATVLTKALASQQQGAPSDVLSRLGEAHAALAVQIPAAQSLELFGLSNLIVREVDPPPEAGEGDDRRRVTIARVCARLSAQELVEVLKWPFCVGEIQKLVLAELEKKTGRTFDGDIWKLVEQSSSLGITDLDRPAKRPRAESGVKQPRLIQAK